MLLKRKIKRVPLSEMDTIKRRQKIVGQEQDAEMLSYCEKLWLNLEPFRIQGDRANEFTYGDQWGDLIEVDGVLMTQRRYLQQQGNFVLQTNQIKNKVDTIVGVMVKEQNEPVCNAIDRDEQQYGEVMTATLQANCNKNRMQSLYIKWMKDLCIRGLALAHESWEYRMGRLDTWTDYCEPNRIFFDSEMTDPRFGDIHTIGQFFDLTPNQLAARFARNERDYSILAELYPSQFLPFQNHPAFDPTDRSNSREVFTTPEDNTKCRVFEVWIKEARPRYRYHDRSEGYEDIVDADDTFARQQVRAENESRKAQGKAAGWDEQTIKDNLIEEEFFIDEFWYCRFLSPDGHILWEGESPYADKLHPFSIVATPFVGGKIVGYMNDAIDHNIAMNRAIVLQDWLIRSQAKGVTVVPKGIVPDQDFKEFARSWTSIDDMVFVDIKPGQEGLMPKVFYGAQTFNASELINTYSKLMENSTAISGAIQGKTPYSGTSGSLYAQMAANSSTPIAALMTQFHSFMEDVQTKKMKNIAMFYTADEFEKIAGRIDGILDAENLNLHEMAHIDMDLIIRESTDTGVARAAINDDAKEFLLNNLISFEEYLTIAKVPYADKILQGRQARQAEAEQLQAMEGVPSRNQNGEPVQ